MSTVTVRIENAYECGRKSESVVVVGAPEFIDTESMERWWEDVVYDETGDGHPCGASEGSNYEATIIGGDHPSLIGQRMEWG